MPSRTGAAHSYDGVIILAAVGVGVMEYCHLNQQSLMRKRLRLSSPPFESFDPLDEIP